MSVSYYDENSQIFFENTVNVDLSSIYKEFLPHVKKNGSILDAGCGSGRDSLYFKKLGYKVMAFDASKQLIQLAETVLKQKVELATFDSFNSEQQYDGIWACASLLHVAKEDLEKTFVKLSQLLAIDGIFYCSFKYGDQDSEKEGRSFTNLNEELLQKLIEKTSLKVNKIWVTLDKRPNRGDEKWLNALLVRIS